MTAPRPIPRLPDPLAYPPTSPDEAAADYAVAPLNRAAVAADRLWGQDALPGLVAPEMAARYGSALGKLNAAIEAGDADAIAARAAVCLRGLAAMDAAARAAGHTPPDPRIWEYELDGFCFAVLADDAEWPVLRDKRPDLLQFTMRLPDYQLK